MKKLLLSCFLCLGLAQTDFAQTSVYHPFPSSNAFWNVEISQTMPSGGCQDFNGQKNPMMQDYRISYFLQGDTVIDNKTYHKIYQSGTVNQHCFYNTGTWGPIQKHYAGAYRQDIAQKKVFIWKAGSEYLLYDFNLAKDSIIWGIYNCGIVTSVDSVLVGNSYRKRFNTSSHGYSLIEGVGSTAGLLEIMCFLESIGKLNCFNQDDGKISYPTSGSCPLLTSANEKKLENALKIYPNPFSTQAVITFDNPLRNSSIIIYNSFGQIVKAIGNISGQTIALQRENLASGLYFVKICSEGKYAGAEKIVIE